MSRNLTIRALLVVLAALMLAPAAAHAAFGLKKVEGFQRTPETKNAKEETVEGSPLLRAGAHPDVNFTFFLNETKKPKSTTYSPDGNVRDVTVNLPTGLIGDPLATETCNQSDLVSTGPNADCDPDSQVGIAKISLEGAEPPSLVVPIYNVTPPRGVAAEFGFNVVSTLVFLDAAVTAEGGYHIVARSRNISQALAVTATSITLWGTPASPVHDSERAPKGGFSNEGTPIPYTGKRVAPLMSNPTSCTGAPLRTVFQADSWEGAFSENSYQTDPKGVPTVITGCDQVPFEALMTAQPTSHEADAPTGINVTVRVPQNEFLEGTATSALREAVVSFPSGMAINPATAGGLGACTASQIGLGNDNPATCPDNSKVGTVKITTPLLEESLEGDVFVARQRENPFGSLLAIYLAVADPETGVVLKIPGRIETNPVTGQLVARFSEAPQLPFSMLQVSLFGGPRAALVTPPQCGTYSTTAQFSPWSGNDPVASSDNFAITTGPLGSACPTGAFTPTFEAGTADSSAGAYSPFELRISRADGSERLSRVDVRLPKGLLAKLAGIPYCSDAILASVPTTEQTGAAQLATPSCPAASRVGRVSVAAGAGTSPYYVNTGTAYLAGPYKGAPLSLAIVTPALAGPFDLGNVVVRAALDIDPTTTQVSVASDPLPTILDGIPLDLREVRVTLDRPEFTVNPTNCAPGAIESTLVATSGASAAPSRPFAASSCGGLRFAPGFNLSLKGGTKRGQYPALTAMIRTQKGQANFARVSVALPHSEFLAQEHIGTICTRVQFAADKCPKASIYGHAVAVSPLLGKPLRGPVYLRSSKHELPDLVVALRGQITVNLDGRIDSKNQGIRTTFEGIPDAPFSSFRLSLGGGKKSLLANSSDICAKRGRADVGLRGQNGSVQSQDVPIRVSCGKGKKKSGN